MLTCMNVPAGRPPSENPRSKVIPVRLTEDEHALIVRAAQAAGEPVGVWIRTKAVAAAKRAKT